MTAKRPYLEALDIPLWLPRRPLAVQPQPQPLNSLLPEGEEVGVRANSSEEGTYQDGPCFAMAIDDRALPELLFPDDGTPLPEENWEPVIEPDPADFAPAAPNRRAATIARMDWEELTAEARQCQACDLCTTRTQVVFGVGDRQAEWLVIGEGPGADEDQQGEPFVGRAGKLLNPMLLAIGLKREQAYITNIVRCRPPENREPTPEEAAQCRPFLNRQIALIRPRIILAVGRIAAQNLLATDTPIGKLRGQVHRFGPARIPLVVTYHPAYLLRSPREKRRAWDDLRLARRVLASEPPA